MKENINPINHYYSNIPQGFMESVFHKITNNGLGNIKEYLKSNPDRVQVNTLPMQVYSSLFNIENIPSCKGLQIIDNESLQAQLVLLSNSKPIIYVEYKEDGDIERISFIQSNNPEGLRHQMFNARYTLFMVFEE
ncbi:MAG TPA: hypothetical protein GX018_03740 [Bacteroidales bacterium]|jgi:hypothetical protein|nr:hypothetical protein [Bacteroidales bacterium]